MLVNGERMESLYDVLQHMDVVAYPLYETYKPSSRDRGVMQFKCIQTHNTWMLHYYGVGNTLCSEIVNVDSWP
jgi:hypothetical protein